MKHNFFAELEGFHDFSDLSTEKHYVQAPDDWTLVITDIEGSTKAIEAGQYKTVNMAGAATVAAVVNAVGSRDIPFVFGGDGATALVPNEHLERVRAALSKSREVTFLNYGLKLRTGLVPVKDLIDAGHPVRVAKYLLTPKQGLAFFKGSGLTMAEAWVKAGKYRLPLEPLPLDFDPHAGLSCRWAPLTSRQGSFLSILVKMHEDTVEQDEFLKKFLRELDDILDFKSSKIRPVTLDQLRVEKFLSAVRLEVGFQHLGNFWCRFLKSSYSMLIVRLLNRGLVRSKTFDMKQYKESLVAHSDFRKFDETLRMVVDTTPQMRMKIEALLENYHQLGKLSYGIFESSTALMTCFVQDFQEQHIHFIDGGNGGYARAAAGLKAQLLKRSNADSSEVSQELEIEGSPEVRWTPA